VLFFAVPIQAEEALYESGIFALENNRCVIAVEPLQMYVDSGETEHRIDAMQALDDASACAARYDEAMASANEALSDGDNEAVAEALREAVAQSAEPIAVILLAEALTDLDHCDQARALLDSLNPDELSETQTGLVETARVDLDDCVDVNDEHCFADCEAERVRLNDEYLVSTRRQRTAGIVITSVGAASLIAAVAHDLASQSTLDEFEAARDAGDTEREEELRQSINGRQDVSFALYASGIAFTVVGAVVWVASRRQNPADVMDCDGLCWGLDGPGDAGGWVGLRF